MKHYAFRIMYYATGCAARRLCRADFRAHTAAFCTIHPAHVRPERRNRHTLPTGKRDQHRHLNLYGITAAKRDVQPHQHTHGDINRASRHADSCYASPSFTRADNAVLRGNLFAHKLHSLRNVRFREQDHRRRRNHPLLQQHGHSPLRPGLSCSRISTPVPSRLTPLQQRWTLLAPLIP